MRELTRCYQEIGFSLNQAQINAKKDQAAILAALGQYYAPAMGETRGLGSGGKTSGYLNR